MLIAVIIKANRARRSTCYDRDLKDNVTHGAVRAAALFEARRVNDSAVTFYEYSARVRYVTVVYLQRKRR